MVGGLQVGDDSSEDQPSESHQLWTVQIMDWHSFRQVSIPP